MANHRNNITNYDDMDRDLPPMPANGPIPGVGDDEDN